MCSDLFGDFVARPRRVLRAPAARRRVRDRRQDGAARERDPADDRVAALRPDREPVGARPHARRLQRRLGGRGRGRHGPDRARQRRRRLDPDPGRRAAVWSGSSRRAGRVSVGPDGGPELPGRRRRADPDGRRHRGGARRARRLRARRRDLGAAARPTAATPGARASIPGGCGSGWRSTRRSRGPTLDPVCEQAARDAAALLESLGHDVEEITPPWSGLDLLPDFTRAFGPLIALTTWCSAAQPRRARADRGRRRAADLGDVRARAEQDTLDVPDRAGPARVGGPLDRRVPRAVRRGADAGARRSGRCDRRDPRPRSRPVGPLPALGRVHAVHRDRQRHRPAGDRRCRSTRARTGCRPRSS